MTTQKTTQREDKSPSGAFESCFATGLDLSEFSASTTVTTSNNGVASVQASASQKLLEETQRKAEQRRVEERQELALEQALQGRKVVIASTSSKPRNKAHAALVHMHAIERSDEPRQRLVKKGPKTWNKPKMSKASRGKTGKRHHR